jgi:predicted small secreted protein
MRNLRFGLVAALVLLTSCNTVQGAGRDINSVGKAIDESAGAAKD